MQKDRVDKSTVGWEHREVVQKHSSQEKTGKVDSKFEIGNSIKNFSTVDQEEKQVVKTASEVIKSDTKSLRARFEQFAKTSDDETQKKLEQERQKRIDREKIEKEEAKKAEEDRQAKLEQQQSLIEENEPNEEDDDDDKEEPQTKSPHLNKIGVSVFPMLVQNNAPSSTKEIVLEESIVQQSTESSEIIQPEQDEEDQWESSTSPITAELASGDLGITATALYDYEAAESDEISFNPYEKVTNIEMVDEGWWRGMCRGHTGLFPANYVKLDD